MLQLYNKHIVIRFKMSSRNCLIGNQLSIDAINVTAEIIMTALDSTLCKVLVMSVLFVLHRRLA